MGVVLVTLAFVVVSLAVLVVLATFIPLDFVVRVGTVTRFRLRGRWLFGLVRFDLPGRSSRESTSTSRERASPPRRTAAEDRGRRPRRRRARVARRLLAIDGLAPRVARLVRELVRAFGWRRAWVEVHLGLGDPALTGELCGFVSPWLVLAPWRPVEVRFEPDFDHALLDAEAGASGRLVPARLIGALGRFAVSRPGLRTLGVLAWRR